LSHDRNGLRVYLRDIWPTQAEIDSVIESSVKTERFRHEYGRVLEGDEPWNTLVVPTGDLITWDLKPTYVLKTSYFNHMPPELAPISDIRNARVLAILGDSVTTDHISPAGEIPVNTPPGRYPLEHGVAPEDFNIYGARRGNHEVMMRGTFANIHLRNLLSRVPKGTGPCICQRASV
jgi:aconitate hydratase